MAEGRVCIRVLGNLSNDVFERRTSTGSEVFSLLICLDANKFVLLSFSSLIKTIYPRFSTEPLPNDAKSPLPVDVRRSKTLLLKLPNVCKHGGDVTSKCVFAARYLARVHVHDLQDVVHTRALIGRVASLHESIYCM